MVADRCCAPHSSHPLPAAQEIRSSNCLLFLGAGFSFPAGLPGWTDLLVKAAEEAARFVELGPPYDLGDDVFIESAKLENNQVRITVTGKASRVCVPSPAFREVLLVT